MRSTLQYISRKAERISEDTIRRSIQTAMPEEGDALVATLSQIWEERGRQEGLQIGKQEGLQIGKQEGVQIGREEGELIKSRHAILRVLEARFGLVPGNIKSSIETISDATVLDRLLQNAAIAKSMDDFRGQFQ